MTLGDEETTAVFLSDEVLDAVAELRSIRSDVSDLKRRESAVRAEILQALDGAQRGLTASGDAAVKIRIQVRRTVSGSQLEALYPDIYDEVMTEKEVTVVDLP